MWGRRCEPKFVTVAEYETDVILPILQIIKLSLREVKWVVPDHPAERWPGLRQH